MSPGRPITRLMKTTCVSRGYLKTAMSPRAGEPKWYMKRATSTRSPGSSVGTMDGDGMRYGLTTKACSRKATASATTRMTPYSTNTRRGDDRARPLAAVVSDTAPEA